MHTSTEFCSFTPGKDGKAGTREDNELAIKVILISEVPLEQIQATSSGKVYK